VQLSAIIKEFKDRIRQDCINAMRDHLKGFGKPLSQKLKGIERLFATSEFRDGKIEIALEFLSRNRFYIFLSYKPNEADGELTRIDTFDNLPLRDELEKGYWSDARHFPCFRDLDDDFWVPNPPSPERFIDTFLESEKGRAELTFIIVDDDLAAEALEFGKASAAVMEEIGDYLENISNPWAEVRAISKLRSEDIDFAVGGKVDHVIKNIADLGLMEFCGVLE
jgi:hypothetical protein